MFAQYSRGVKDMINPAKWLLQILHGDASCKSRTNLGAFWRFALAISTVFSSIFLSIFAHAQLDTSFAVYARSYPRSGVLEGEIGYGNLLWGGSGGAGGSDIMYGYIRPFAVGATSGTYNSLAAGVDFFPVSFLGVRGGGEYSNNSRRYVDFDCYALNCLGTRYRSFFEAQVFFGNKQIFGQVKMRRQRWSQDQENAGNFVDPTSGLEVKANGDSETVWQSYLGVTINPSWKVILGNRYSEMSNIKGVSQFVYLGGQYNWAPISASFGVGSFASALKEREISYFLVLGWELYPTIGLH